jgi:hypothetical protein
VNVESVISGSETANIGLDLYRDCIYHGKLHEARDVGICSVSCAHLKLTIHAVDYGEWLCSWRLSWNSGTGRQGGFSDRSASRSG